MRKRPIAFVFLFFIVIASHAQDSCNCLTNLDSMIRKVSNNYAGYKDKVNAHTQTGYQSLVDSLQKEAVTKLHMGDCFPLLEKYRLYFYDKHLQLRLKEQQASQSANAQINPPPVQTKWKKQSLTDSLHKQRRKLDPVEGIWTTEGYEIGIRFNVRNKRYDAVVLTAANKNWKEGMLKFSSKPSSHGLYETEYYRGDFVKDNIHLNVYRNIIEIENYGLWKKVYPAITDTISSAEYTKSHAAFGSFQLRYLDANTVYIALKSCDLSIKPILDSTMFSNKERLKNISNWIVDFRGNEGGSTDVFSSLLPYLYTKPMYEKGSSHWLTTDNTGELKKFRDESKALLDTATLHQLNAWFEFEKANPNGWYRDKADSVKFDSVRSYPQRVAILSDRNNASSGETFLIVAHGLSNKVTIMGENSAGYLDYGDLLPSSLPCDKLAFYIPSRRANYVDDGVSYDRTGYPPDVYIPAGTTDWIAFVYNWWNTKH
ncbi:MAG: S41 family peptidase [Bacteroidota bacterium]